MKNLHLFLSLQERRQLCMDARTTFEVGRDVALRAVDDGETVERLAQAMASSHPDPFQPGTVVRFLEEIFCLGGGWNHEPCLMAWFSIFFETCTVQKLFFFE